MLKISVFHMQFKAMGKEIKQKKRARHRRKSSGSWNHLSMKYGSHQRRVKWGSKELTGMGSLSSTISKLNRKSFCNSGH